MSFNSEMNLSSNKPMAASGKPSINRLRSDNTDYKNNDTIRIEIPTGAYGQYIFPKNSFIEGKVKVNTTRFATNTTATYIDGSVFSLFHRLKLIHGAQTIEDLLYCDRVWTSVMDLQYNETERKGLSITHLMAEDKKSLAGFLFDESVTAATTDSKYVDFSFNLPSALVGCLASKSLPVGEMTASSLYIELELNAPNVAFVTDSLPNNLSSTIINSFTVSDVHYNAKVVTLPSDVNAALLQTTGGIINLPGIAYKCELKSIAGGQSTFNDKFSFQFSSIKNFLFFVMNSAAANGINQCRSITSRPRANIKDYYITINGEAYPSQTIEKSSVMYSNLMRSFDSLCDTNSGGIIGYNSYCNSNVSTTASSYNSSTSIGTYGNLAIQQRFIAGLDLDRFNHGSQTLMSGTSSNGQMVNLNLNFDTNNGETLNQEALNLYAFVQYDVIYNIENGRVSMRT
jgi:hypothetical protein